jgi:hypothetical protein
MSLSDASNKVIYAGDGMTTTFAISPALPTGSTGTDVYVYVVDNLGVVTLLTSNYSVDLNTLLVTYPTVGGVLPLLPGINAVPIGWEIVITRYEPLSQTLALTNNGVWDGPSIDAAFDKLTMICQQLQEQLDRATLAAINQPAPAATVLPPILGGLLQATGTLAQLIVQSGINPTGRYFGVATDIGGGQIVFYPGYASTNGIQGSGWYAIGGGI